MMKDKLYKNHHKTMYYVVRKAALSFSIFLGLAVAVAIPTTVNLLTTNEAQRVKAQEKVETEDNNIEENSELSYLDNK